MKSKTSYFNKTVFLKDITRFSPLWVLYTICLGLVLFLAFSNRPAWDNASNLSFLLISMVWVNLVYAILCAVMLFGDLCNSRLCNALHAMPLRREGWFFTHFSAGLLFSLVPNLLLVLLNLSFFGRYWYFVLIWLGGTVLEFLFFFGLSCFCALCAGSRLGTVALYAILNFFPLLFYGWIQTLYIPRLPGLIWNVENLLRLFPFLNLQQDYLFTHVESPAGTEDTIFYFDGFSASAWGYLFCLALLGLVLAALAVLLYRKRNMEAAGDLAAFRPVAPVFLVVFSMAAGLIFFEISSIFTDYGEYTPTNLFFLFSGIAIGFFAGQMLLHKTIKVWKKKTIFSFLGAAVLIGLSFLLTSLDPVGISRRVPKPETVAHCYINVSGSELDLDSPSDLEMIEDIHKKLIIQHNFEIQEDTPDTIDPESPRFYSYPVYLTYHLKNGHTMSREYYCTAIPDAEPHRTLRQLFTSWQAILQTEDLNTLAKSLANVNIYIYNADTSSENYMESIPRRWILPLLEAVKKDCEEGTILPGTTFINDYNEQQIGDISFEKSGNSLNSYHTSRYFDAYLTENSRHTREIIKEIYQKEYAQ